MLGDKREGCQGPVTSQGVSFSMMTDGRGRQIIELINRRKWLLALLLALILTNELNGYMIIEKQTNKKMKNSYCIPVVGGLSEVCQLAR